MEPALPLSMSLRGEHILVTGAAGFIGSHLVERLLALGATVTGVDNFDPFYPPEEKRANLSQANEHPAFRLIEADCAEPSAVEAGLDGSPIDAIVHLAGKAGVRPSLSDPSGYVRANVAATQAMLDLAGRRGVERLIFGSSSSVYGNSARLPFSEDDRADHPVSPYAASKRAAELLCATHNHLYRTGIIALRFFTVYGPRQRPDLAIRKFSGLMLRDEPIPLFGNGATARDYTWIDDILDGVTAAVERTRDEPGRFEIINLGGSRTTSLDRLVELLADALRVTPRILRLPLQPGDVLRTHADVRKAERLLGYSPKTPIEEGIPRFAEWVEGAAVRV
ncbi:MAG TPA: NAD-dependent epimerase/dehydratase family protein [Gemmatimonadales bacterium]|nr:NAD-dependent epimerase/dehydratase family protein [Gemmatimonadales bacterium]